MLATQTPDPSPEAKDVTQRIKEKLVLSLKALQKRYVTSDAVVTSEDGDANLLCCALEAIFIHGLKSKHIHSEAAGRKKKRARGSLPQPVFWSLLKTVTHRDVIEELEKLSFVSTDVGRCRAWLRLALNHGLLECYLVSLFREGSKLGAHYQPTALLLNAEEREVLISYLQGLASLTFDLSYKSAVLNEWTTTPLALAGLCPAAQADALEPPSINGTASQPKESWDTASQSSGTSDTVEVHRGGPGGVLVGKGTGALPGSRTAMNSSNLSLDTTGSSQLSSSLSSDSLLQGQDPRSDLDLSLNGDSSTKRPPKDVLSDFRSSGHSSQDSMREEDSFVSSVGPDHISDTTACSGSDSEIHGPATAVPVLADRTTSPSPPRSEPAPESVLGSSGSRLDTSSESRSDTEVAISKPVEEEQATNYQKETEIVQKDTEVEVMKDPAECSSEPSANGLRTVFSDPAFSRSASMLSRKMSAESLSYTHSWISDDDIYKPHLEEVSDLEESSSSVNGLISPTSEPEVSQSPPSVVHHRKIGLSNPFRGLLKLGHLEYCAGVLGRWRDYYCELSPFEFRLYLDAEERTGCENFSLLRCEDARVTSTDRRFELAFSGKRLYLRAANHDEAEDWVDRVVEAANKCRPTSLVDEQWEVLQVPLTNGLNEPSPSPSSAPSSPERGLSSTDVEGGGGCTAPPPLPPQNLDWTRSADPEPDAIKEAVLYFSPDADGRTWVRLVFSLSLEVLKGFWVQEGRKSLRMGHPIEVIRDVVPAVSLGGEAFFKLLTCKETLRLRAESPEEARAWRALIRGALDSYLDSGEDGLSEETAAGGQGIAGNIHRLVQHRLKGDGVLLAHLYTVPSERGLDKQNFKCAGCAKQIGLSLGRARLCEFSGQYYCDSCHLGDTTIIPARMVHNWDLTAREVSRKALGLLDEIEQEPLLNLEQLNPELMAHAEPMGQAHRLRQSLRLLGDYLLTCRSGACKKVQARLQQRTYLLESSHLYSVIDLRQIAAGQYVAYLSTLVQFASSHVHQCELCSQRGFYCQICNSNDVIFPFQVDSTTRCKDCKAVFHLACHAQSPSCPRCQRRKKYLDDDDLHG